MILARFDELWHVPGGHPYMIVLITHAVADDYGKLMMMRGSALQAREVYPQLPRMAVTAIKTKHPQYRLNGREDYGFVPVIDPPHGIGLFQVSRHWATATRIENVKQSAGMLAEYARVHPDVMFRLPFPSWKAGHWGTGREPSDTEITAALEDACLPDNVTVIRWR